MTTNKTISLALLAGVATIASLQPAMALDAQAFVDRISAVYGAVGYDIQFGPATLDGDTITVDGVTLNIKSLEAEPMQFDTQLTFNGVAEQADGSYTADSVTIPDIEADIEADVPGHVSLSDIALEGFYLPAPDKLGFQAMMQVYGSFSTGPLSVTRNGEEVISFSSIEAVNSFNPAQADSNLVDVSSTLAINDISVDLASVKEEDPEAGAVIDGLGLTNVTGNITGSMGWAAADGRMNVDQFLIDLDDLGAIDIAYDITGLTPALMDEFYKAQAKMLADGADPTSEEAQAAQMMMGMQMAQGISIAGASIRYDDASLAGKLLDFFGAAQGADRATLVEGLKAMLPQMLAGTGVPALADLIVPPVSAFLDNPQSLEVAVAPPSPTSLLVLTAAAANPAGLISALGLTVTANEAAQ